MISEKFDYRDSTLTNNGSTKSDINIVNVSPISNFNNWSACPHSLVNWFVRIPYRDIAALNAVPGVTIWSSNTVVIDRTPNKIIDICGHINLKSLATWHFPFTVIQTVNFWITSDCERITFIANLKNKKIKQLLKINFLSNPKPLFSHFRHKDHRKNRVNLYTVRAPLQLALEY